MKDKNSAKLVSILILITLGLMYFFPTKVSPEVCGGIVIAFVAAFKDFVAVFSKEESATQPLIDALAASSPPVPLIPPTPQVRTEVTPNINLNAEEKKSRMNVEIQKFINEIENFILKIAHKSPSWLDAVCQKAISYTDKAELLLNNATVVDFAKLVPEAEIGREDIIAALNTLLKIFTTVDIALQQGLVNSTGAKIASALHGQGLPANNFIAPISVMKSKMLIESK